MAQQDAQNGGSKNAVAAATMSFVVVKPQLLVETPKANVAILFFKVAFGTEEVRRTLNPKRKAKHELPLILSAELKIAGSTILVTDLVDDTSSLLVFSHIHAKIRNQHATPSLGNTTLDLRNATSDLGNAPLIVHRGSQQSNEPRDGDARHGLPQWRHDDIVNAVDQGVEFEMGGC
ncbi:hypothetical protein JHK87_039885 [Glycine soja]|nr:hypothetical protein JHK87_039885 [Glycine soja]